MNLLIRQETGRWEKHIGLQARSYKDVPSCKTIHWRIGHRNLFEYVHFYFAFLHLNLSNQLYFWYNLLFIKFLTTFNSMLNCLYCQFEVWRVENGVHGYLKKKILAFEKLTLFQPSRFQTRQNITQLVCPIINNKIVLKNDFNIRQPNK